jgi:ferritin-like metal-binding protein YciE
MENASVERHQRSITKETDIEELKIVIQKHLPETRWYQKRLEERQYELSITQLT